MVDLSINCAGIKLPNPILACFSTAEKLCVSSEQSIRGKMK